MDIKEEAKKITSSVIDQALIANLAEAQYQLGYIAGRKESQTEELYKSLPKQTAS